MNLYDTYGYMAMAIAAVCCIALAGVRKSYVEKVGLATCGVWLILAERRGGFLVADLLVALGVLLIIPIMLFAPFLSRKKVLIWGVIAFVGLAIGAAMFLDFANIEPRIAAIMNFGLLADASIFTRYNVSDMSWNSFSSHPLLGIGLIGGTEDAYDYIGLHSSIVDVPAQLGLLGFLGYFGFILLPLKRALSNLRKHDTDLDSQQCALIVALGLILFFVGTILNPVFMRNLLNETLVLLAALSVTLPAAVVRRRKTSDLVWLRTRPAQSSPHHSATGCI